MRNVSLRTQRKGQLGVNAVERVILKDWRSRWQPIDGFNDDGVDGLIFIEAGGQATGQVVYTQIKYRSIRKEHTGEAYSISFATKKNSRSALERRIRSWRQVVGAAILVCVVDDGKQETTYWVDLRDAEAWQGSTVHVPKVNRFDAAARRIISRLCGTLNQDLLREEIITEKKDFDYLTGTNHLQTNARRFYKELRAQKLHFKGSQADIRFTREGWHHLTRRRRSRLTQLQSFQLLGALPRIIETHSEEDLRIFQVRSQNGVPIQCAQLEASVRFPFRQSAIVTTLFRRRALKDDHYSYSFWTIYEPRRRAGLTGTKKK
jgi:hypothetical protein